MSRPRLRRLGGMVAAAAALRLAAATVRRLVAADAAGQSVLVTGASRGLGFLLAREYGRRGGRVTICARDAAALGAAAADLRRDGVEVLAVPCDVRDGEQVANLVAAARDRFGRIDVLVNNAGIIVVGPVEAMTAETWTEAMATMFWGVVHPTLAVLPEMLGRQSGRIVTVTSIGGKVAVPHLLPYCAAKFAAVGFSEGLAAELAGRGVGVTTVVPGLMRTGSFLNARFTGRAVAESRLFALAASLPGISIGAERAARRIVAAAERGDAEVVLTLPAMAAARAHGLVPATMTRALGLVARVLPAGNGRGPAPRGLDLGLARAPLLRALGGLGLAAAARTRQYGAAGG